MATKIEKTLGAIIIVLLGMALGLLLFSWLISNYPKPTHKTTYTTTNEFYLSDFQNNFDMGYLTIDQLGGSNE